MTYLLVARAKIGRDPEVERDVTRDRASERARPRARGRTEGVQILRCGCKETWSQQSSIYQTELNTMATSGDAAASSDVPAQRLSTLAAPSPHAADGGEFDDLLESILLDNDSVWDLETDLNVFDTRTVLEATSPAARGRLPAGSVLSGSPLSPQVRAATHDPDSFMLSALSDRKSLTHGVQGAAARTSFEAPDR